MNTFITVVSSVLVFGFLIFIHEFGHYITARIFHVTIEEFSIGMGPRLISWVSKKTGIRYSISLLPIGGFVSMPGENGEYNGESGEEGDGESDPYASDPNTFGKKPAWQRFIITAAGAAVNITAGFLAMVLYTSLVTIGNNTVTLFVDKDTMSESIGTEVTVSSSDSGLMLGDEIIRIGGKRIYIPDEIQYEIMRKGNKPVDITVLRNGEEITLKDVVFPTSTESDQTFGVMDFKVKAVKKTPWRVIRHSWCKSTLIVRMCWESLYDLITGRYTFAAVSGPVGISTAIGSAAKAGFLSVLYITVLISINLGIMNLLPIPALDGARVLTILIEMITKKKLPPKVEGAINGIGLILLLALSAVIMVKDILQLIF